MTGEDQGEERDDAPEDGTDDVGDAHRPVSAKGEPADEAPDMASEDVEDSAAPSAPEEPSSARPSARASRPPDDDDEGRRRQRRKLEGLLRESFRRAVEKGVEAGIGAIGSGVDAFEKGVEASRGTMKQASTQFRGVVDEVKLPKEAASYLLGQIDETKNVLIRSVSREVRDFLAETDIAHELQRALTSLSFEIRTEIRFVPNEKGVMKAEVKSRAAPHRVRDDETDDGAD
jgi:hypothetical protein